MLANVSVEVSKQKKLARLALYESSIIRVLQVCRTVIKEQRERYVRTITVT